MLLAPQVSRDLCVPEAKGLRHLVLLEAKVPTGWQHQSQKLLHGPGVGPAIAGLEDLEAGMRGWGTFLGTWEADPLLPSSSHLSDLSSRSFLCLLLLPTRAPCPGRCGGVEWESRLPRTPSTRTLVL